MKKIALILAVVVMVSLLAACGGKGQPEGNNVPESEPEEEEAVL